MAVNQNGKVWLQIQHEPWKIIYCIKNVSYTIAHKKNKMVFRLILLK